jgi:hypothetical protein
MEIQRTLPDLAGLINAEHEACLASANDTVARYIKTGQYLTEAKAQVQHGEWAGWVEVNCRFGTRQASSYMRAYANRREQIGSAASDFDSLRGAIAALVEPMPVVDYRRAGGGREAVDPAGSIPSEAIPSSTRIPTIAAEPAVAVITRPKHIITPVPIARLKAPFPYHGGKWRAAGIIWACLGDVRNYIEPCCGSAAVLWARPHPPQIETVNDPTLVVDNFRRATHPERGDPGATADALCEVLNDADPYIANLWRSTREAPEETASWADNPVDESFLHAVHRYLVLGEEAAQFRERIRQDMDYFDARRAGLWAWGACTWIGSGWCRVPSDESRAAAEPPDKLPRLVGGRRGDTYYGDLGVNAGKCPQVDGMGVHRRPEGIPDKRPQLCTGNSHHGPGVHRQPEGILHDGRPQLADAYARGRGVHSNNSAETCRERREWLVDWFRRLRDRLRTVRVCCGDWRRVCSSKSTTVRLGLTGIFFDPPYSAESGRTADLYGVDSLTMAHDIREYCLEHGGDPRFRIVLAGLAGEGHEVLEEHGWTVVPWKSQGGYGNRSAAGKDRTRRERLWCSPHTLHPDAEPSLFDDLED